MTYTDKNKTLRATRWVARIAAGIMAFLILIIFSGEALADGFAPLQKMSVREMTMMAAFFVLWVGLIVSWRWELFGGLLTIGGTAAFYLLDYLFSGTFPRGPFFLIFASPSLLFIYYGWRIKKKRTSGIA